MRFRPCIDIHNGKVKQIIGGSLNDADDSAQENFVSERGAAWFADFFRRHDLPGGHIILLNPPSSEYYDATRAQALEALAAYPEGLQIGGGITPENAGAFIDAGASHVIVTSYVFRDGVIDYDRLLEMVAAVGSDRLVLDLSCRKKGDDYFVVTDRWQKFTDTAVTPALLGELAEYCDEFLVHAADVEGRMAGVETELVEQLCGCSGDGAPITTTTYAGGISSLEDIALLRESSGGQLDFTVGSALDLFGGPLPLTDVIAAGSDPL